MRQLGWFLFLLLMVNLAGAQPGKVYKSLKEVTDPHEVYVLQLRGKRLKAVPSIVYQMTNLCELDLRGNRISHLSDSIALLTQLQRLDLSRNPLMDLPPVNGRDEGVARVGALVNLCNRPSAVVLSVGRESRCVGFARLPTHSRQSGGN